MPWTFLSAGWRRDPACMSAGAWGRLVTLEVAAMAADEGSWPYLERRLCNPALLARQGGMAGEQPAHIKHGFVRAIAAGLLQPSNDRQRIRVATPHVCIGLTADDDGINRLEIHTASGLVVKNGVSDENLACFYAVTPGDEPSVLTTTSYTSDLFDQETHTTRARARQEPPEAPVTAPKSPKKKKKSAGRPPVPTSEELGIFHAWRDGMELNANTKPSPERVAAIRKANEKMGFSHPQLRQSVEGWVMEFKRNDWMRERRSRHELAMLLRTTAKIEEGMDLYAKGSGQTRRRPAATAPASAEVESMIREMLPAVMADEGLDATAARKWIINNCDWAKGAPETTP